MLRSIRRNVIRYEFYRKDAAAAANTGENPAVKTSDYVFPFLVGDGKREGRNLLLALFFLFFAKAAFEGIDLTTRNKRDVTSSDIVRKKKSA